MMCCGMVNLLEETKDDILSNGEKIENIICVQNERGSMSWGEFCSIAAGIEYNYDTGYSGVTVALDLMVIGVGFWLERSEHDDADEWSFKKYSEIKERVTSVTKLDILEEGRLCERV